MKITFKFKTVALLFTVLSMSVFAGNPVTINPEDSKSEGIIFHEGTWDEALKKAKAEDKPIFLDISASWCGPCKLLKQNTFPDANVGEYYNKHFVNVLIDGEKGEGPELARKFSIRGYPTMIFLDSDGELITQTAGYRDPEGFLAIGKQVINR